MNICYKNYETTIIIFTDHECEISLIQAFSLECVPEK